MDVDGDSMRSSIPCLAQRLRNAEAIDFRFEMAAANVVKKHRRLFKRRAMWAPRQAFDRVQNEPVVFRLEDRLEHCLQRVRQRGCANHGCVFCNAATTRARAVSSVEVTIKEMVTLTAHP